MPVRLIDLRNVLDDEAEELRRLLCDNGIEYYETSAGNWGISVPAIWLHDDSQLESARRLVAAYQDARFARARDEYDRLKRAGRQPTLVDRIRDDPLQFVLYLAAIAVVLYLSIKPFTEIGR